MSVWRHLRAIGLLPVTVTVVVPALIVALTRSTHVGWGLPPVLRPLPLVAGGVLVAGGLALVVRTVTLFATVGRGTLAPWDPTQRLVVRGVYRHVRNPMISGVFSIVLGEAVALGSLPLLGWAAVFLAGNAAYIPAVEEPGLERRFGEEYRAYRRQVPAWIPRLHPWEPWADGR